MASVRSSLTSFGNITFVFLFTAIALSAGPVLAFIDPPVLIPSNPVAGETISVSIHHGYCDAFITPPLPQITQVGNAVHLLLATLHFDDPLWCQSPPSITATFPVGSFPPGDYTLHVERFYDSAVPEPAYETLANIEFTVRAAAPATLPASGIISSLLLIAGVLIAVTLRLALAVSVLPISLFRPLNHVSPERRS